MVTTLVVTNDFPPRIGGIESFVAQVCELLDHDVVVLTSATGGALAHDRTLPYPVIRSSSPVLLPGPNATAIAVRLLHEHRADRVLFGAAAPLALMAPALRRAGARRIVALTHGHERWWAALPGTRHLLGQIGEDVDALSTISDYVAARIAPALSSAAHTKLFRLAPPVDPDVFTPDHGSTDRPRRCIAVGRFVPRKGFGTLLAAWRRIIDAWPADQPLPELVLVGDGRLRQALQRQTTRLGLAGTVRFTGALDRNRIAPELRAADVFAFPVRDRLGGLDPEGLGLAAIEAAACGLPVVVGRSGGAPETVRPGETGYVVDGADPVQLAERVRSLLLDTELCATMGAAGRRFVVERFGTDRARLALRAALALQ